MNFNLPSNETDVGNTTQDINLPGYRSFGQVTGTVDVSGLASGKLTIFYGAFSATPVISAVMRDLDGGAPDLDLANLHQNGDTAQRTEFYAAELDFETDGIYDVIIYDYEQPGTGNGRSGGVVLTGVIPEPSSLALLALGSLMLARRRR